MIAFFQRFHARAYIDDDTRAFMAQDRRKNPFRIGAGPRELVGMANTCGLNLNQNLALTRAVQFNSFDTQRLPRLKGHGGTRLHQDSPSKSS